MKKHKEPEQTELEKLKAKYPDLVYSDGELWIEDSFNVAFVSESELQFLLIDHYDGREITIPHPSNNPELDEFKAVSGREYLEINFSTIWGGIDWEKAYNNVL